MLRTAGERRESESEGERGRRGEEREGRERSVPVGWLGREDSGGEGEGREGEGKVRGGVVVPLGKGEEEGKEGSPHSQLSQSALGHGRGVSERATHALTNRRRRSRLSSLRGSASLSSVFHSSSRNSTLRRALVPPSAASVTPIWIFWRQIYGSRGASPV